MTITREWLEKHKACDIGMDWFFSIFPNGMEINPENIKNFDEHQDYLGWLLTKEIEVTRELLMNGANVNADGDWAIICAARHGRTDICQLLLEHGANVHTGNDFALEISLEYNHTETATLLKEWMDKK